MVLGLEIEFLVQNFSSVTGWKEDVHETKLLWAAWASYNKPDPRVVLVWMSHTCLGFFSMG